MVSLWLSQDQNLARTAAGPHGPDAITTPPFLHVGQKIACPHWGLHSYLSHSDTFVVFAYGKLDGKKRKKEMKEKEKGKK